MSGDKSGYRATSASEMKVEWAGVIEKGVSVGVKETREWKGNEWME